MIDKSFQALIISLIIHGFLTLAIFSTQDGQFSSDSTSVDVVYLEPESASPKSVVSETEEKDPLLEKVEKESDRLAQFTKRVKEEVQARRSGPTQNRPQAQASREGSSEPQERAPLKDLDLGVQPEPRPEKQPQKQADSRPLELPGTSGNGLKRNIVIGHSSLSEYIPNVQEGSFTALNTDQFMFYSFFSRINEQIRPRWVNGIRAFAQKQSLSELENLALVPRETKIEVILDKEGYLERVLIHRSSGSDGLDHAAAQAFRLASPLLNPPVELAEDDGRVHLYYNFRVHWNPRHLVGR